MLWSRPMTSAGGCSFTTDLADRRQRRRGGVHRGRHAGTARRWPRRSDLRLRLRCASLPPTSTRARWSSPNRPFPSAPATRSSEFSREEGVSDVSVASNPEFLREGAAIADFKHPDRIVVGAEDDRASDVLQGNLPPLVPQPGADPVHRAAHRGADQICRQCLPRGQDQLHQRNRRSVRSGRRRCAGRRARHRARQSHRRPSSSTPAPAMAAAASPRIRWRCSRPPRRRGSTRRIVRTTVAVNDERKNSMAARVADALGGSLDGQEIAVLGLAFKPNTDDMRDAPSHPADRRAETRRGARFLPSIRSRASRPGRCSAGSTSPRMLMPPPTVPTLWLSSPNGTSSGRSTSSGWRAR